MKRFFLNLLTRVNKTWSKWFPVRYRVVEVKGDQLPEVIPKNTLVHVIDDRESWSVGLKCPCGCGDTLELMLLTEIKPYWRLTIDKKGSPTLMPSIWRKNRCGAHFWLKKGVIYWC